MSGALLNLPPPDPVPPLGFSRTQTQHVWLHSLLSRCRGRSLARAPYSVRAAPSPLATLPLALKTEAFEAPGTTPPFRVRGVAQDVEPEPVPNKRTDWVSSLIAGEAGTGAPGKSGIPDMLPLNDLRRGKCAAADEESLSGGIVEFGSGSSSSPVAGRGGSGVTARWPATTAEAAAAFLRISSMLARSRIRSASFSMSSRSRSARRLDVRGALAPLSTLLCPLRIESESPTSAPGVEPDGLAHRASSASAPTSRKKVRSSRGARSLRGDRGSRRSGLPVRSTVGVGDGAVRGRTRGEEGRETEPARVERCKDESSPARARRD